MTRLFAIFALLGGIPMAATHGPEILPGAVVEGPAPNIRFNPAAATNGSEELVVWVDRRAGVSAVVATRIRDGAVLDPLGILIHEGPDQTLPEVVDISNSWLIVWNENTGGHNRVMAARLSRDGTILVPAKMLADYAAGSRRHLAAIGTRAVTVFWRGGEIHALVLDANANILAHHSLASGETPRNNASVTASETQFLVMWDVFGFEDPSRIQAVRLSAAGTPLDAGPRNVGFGQLASAASDGSTFVVVTHDSDFSSWSTFRLSSTLIPGPTFALPGTTISWRISAIRTGSRYAAIGLNAQGQLHVAFLDADGASPPPRVVPWPAESRNGDEMSFLPVRGELLITSMRTTNPDARVIARAERFDAATLARLGTEMLLSRSGNEHEASQFAFDGTNSLVVWRELDGIFATRVTPDGNSLDGRGVELQGASPQWRNFTPRVVFDGTQYVVAWTDSARARIVLRFIDPATGAISDTDEIETEQPLAVLTMAAGSDATLIVWSDAFAQPTATIIDRASRTASAPITLARPGHRVGLASAAWNGTHFLVAWEQRITVAMPGPSVRVPVRIRGTRVTQFLGIVDTEPLLLGDAGSEQALDTAPVVASNGNEWLVAWRSGSLRARRIAADGTGIGGPEGTIVRNAEELTVTAFTSATWDGLYYVLASTTGFEETRQQVDVFWLTPSLGFAGASTLTADASSRIASLANAMNGVNALYLRQIWDAPYGGVDRTVLRQVVRPAKRRAVR